MSCEKHRFVTMHQAEGAVFIRRADDRDEPVGSPNKKAPPLNE
jgi:hypothetical protein